MYESIAPDTSTTRPLASILLPSLAGMSVILCLPALMIHAKSRHFAAAAVVFWITVVNFFNFINPLIWPTDDLWNQWNGVGLCDIEIRLNIASSVGIPGALICIFRQLAVIMDVDKAALGPTPGQSRRQRARELVLCLGGPLLMIVVHFLVQPYRFYIFAISGCVPPIDNSWPSIVLIFVPPLVLCAVAAGYCVVVIVRLLKYRQQFSVILASSPSKLNRSRFLRLFILSTALVVIFLPISIYVFSRNLEYPRHPFSWSSVHPPSWSQLILRVPTRGVVNFDRWLNVGVGYSVFVFFGFGNDAKMMYRSWLLRVGLGKWFPKLHHPHLAQYNRAGSSARASKSLRLGLISHYAKFIFPQKERHTRAPMASTHADANLMRPAHSSSSAQPQPGSGSENETLQPVRL